MINCEMKIAIVKVNKDKCIISAMCKILKYQEVLFTKFNLFKKKG